MLGDVLSSRASVWFSGETFSFSFLNCITNCISCCNRFLRVRSTACPSGRYRGPLGVVAKLTGWEIVHWNIFSSSRIRQSVVNHHVTSFCTVRAVFGLSHSHVFRPRLASIRDLIHLEGKCNYGRLASFVQSWRTPLKVEAEVRVRSSVCFI
jgi:hypothetical protein